MTNGVTESVVESQETVRRMEGDLEGVGVRGGVTDVKLGVGGGVIVALNDDAFVSVHDLLSERDTEVVGLVSLLSENELLNVSN